MVVFAVGLGSVPVLDRDEARFAQATFQMLESGDYWQISFQDVPRTKKPHGIHWLQAMAVEMLSSPAAKAIWAYRVPSAIGAWLAVMFTFLLARDLYGRPTALLAGLLLAVCPLVIVLARVATADGMLLVTVVVAHWVLARAYLGLHGGSPPGWPLAGLFWGAVIASALVKGPVGPGLVVLTLASLVLLERRGRWLLALHPVTGGIVTIVVIAAWSFFADAANQGSFVVTALSEDFLPKLLSGLESHGAPPGTHLVVAMAGLGGVFPFAILGLIQGFRDRSCPLSRFCLAWIVPAWIVFEVVATKLPHYVLPLYPPLAILAAVSLTSAKRDGQGLAHALLGRWAHLIWNSIGFAIAAAAAIYLSIAELPPGLPRLDAFALGILMAIAFAATGYFGWRRRPRDAIATIVFSTFAITIVVFAVMAPRLEAFWVTERIVRSVDARIPNGPERFASVGYEEPSLVFRMGTQTMFLGPDAAAALMAREVSSVVAVDDRYRDEFERSLALNGLEAKPFVSVSGFLYSKGRWITIWLYEH